MVGRVTDRISVIGKSAELCGDAPERHAGLLGDPGTRFGFDPSQRFLLRDETGNVVTLAVGPRDPDIPSWSRLQSAHLEGRIAVWFIHDCTVRLPCRQNFFARRFVPGWVPADGLRLAEVATARRIAIGELWIGNIDKNMTTLIASRATR